LKGWLRFFVSVLVILPMQVAAQESKGFVYLASTIGPIDAGIVDTLEIAFGKDTGVRVRHVGADDQTRSMVLALAEAQRLPVRLEGAWVEFYAVNASVFVMGVFEAAAAFTGFGLLARREAAFIRSSL